MTIPDVYIVDAAAREIAKRMDSVMGELELFTIPQVARMLKVSPPAARRLLKSHIDLGVASTRVSAAQLRELIESRTVNA
jgi:hypothetical protein